MEEGSLGICHTQCACHKALHVKCVGQWYTIRGDERKCPYCRAEDALPTVSVPVSGYIVFPVDGSYPEPPPPGWMRIECGLSQEFALQFPEESPPDFIQGPAMSSMKGGWKAGLTRVGHNVFDYYRAYEHLGHICFRLNFDAEHLPGNIQYW